MIGVTLLAWLAAFGLAMAVGPRARRAGRGARLLALSLVYLPLLCLAAAALEPSVGAERLLVMLGSPALAAVDAGERSAATGRSPSPAPRRRSPTRST